MWWSSKRLTNFCKTRWTLTLNWMYPKRSSIPAHLTFQKSATPFLLSLFSYIIQPPSPHYHLIFFVWGTEFFFHFSSKNDKMFFTNSFTRKKKYRTENDWLLVYIIIIIMCYTPVGLWKVKQFMCIWWCGGYNHYTKWIIGVNSQMQRCDHLFKRNTKPRH